MLTPEIAIELTRARIEEMERRATLVSRLGGLPGPASIFAFRRRVAPLSGPVEVRHAPRPAEGLLVAQQVHPPLV